MAEDLVVACAAIQLVVAVGARDYVVEGIAGAIDVAAGDDAEALEIGAKRIADQGDDQVIAAFLGVLGDASLALSTI